MGRGGDPTVTFDWTTFDSVSWAVIETVAEESATDPMDLRPLYEVIDPESLDGVFTGTETSPGVTGGRVEFEYEGYTVVVRANGRGRLY